MKTNTASILPVGGVMPFVLAQSRAAGVTRNANATPITKTQMLLAVAAIAIDVSKKKPPATQPKTRTSLDATDIIHSHLFEPLMLQRVTGRAARSE